MLTCPNDDQIECLGRHSEDFGDIRDKRTKVDEIEIIP